MEEDERKLKGYISFLLENFISEYEFFLDISVSL
jgi:hypothetical protein